MMLAITLVLTACGGGSSGGAAPPPPPPPPDIPGTGGINDVDKRDRPYVILVSIDGFRWDYPELYPTPNIDRLIATGVRTESLRPVFPTLTFPNHYSIATGLYPSNHGIVANAFPSRDRQRFYSLSNSSAVTDGSWYGGVPIWAAAELNGLVAATYFFVGSEAEIAGVRPSIWLPFDGGTPGDVRVTQVLDWLTMPDDSRPHLITLYFNRVDSTGHQFGPNSAQTAAEVALVDQHIGQLLDGVAASGVADETYIILVSDHGMSSQQPGATDIVLTDIIDTSGMTIIGSGAYAFMFFDQSDPQRAMQLTATINASWQNGMAWQRENAPAEWNVSAQSRFPDIIVQADDRFRVAEDPGRIPQIPLGLHGWAPEFIDMHGVFIASGPRLPAGVSAAEAGVLDVYPLILEILDIPASGPLDGDPRQLTDLLSD